MKKKINITILISISKKKTKKILIFKGNKQIQEEKKVEKKNQLYSFKTKTNFKYY